MMSELTVVDFFCGAGGFSEGFRQMGFNIIKGYDCWQPAINTFNHNFELNSSIKNILDFESSLDEIDLVPNTDVIIGSPPCVSFSSSNKSGKADKSLGLDLIKCFLRVVAVKKHQKGSVLKAWYMENVANSMKYINEIYSFTDLNLEEWATINDIDPEEEALNLRDNTVIINSANYGSYQARKRAISGEIVEVGKLIVPPITHGNEIDKHLLPWNTLGDLMKRLPSPLLKKSDQLIKDPGYDSLRIRQSDLTDHFYDSGLYRSEWRQSKELKTNHYCMGKMSFPENIDKPSRTITATKSGTSREALIYKSEYKREGNGEYRTPTIREAASIMGFPFTYQFIGPINSKWRLVGNAVCPSVSRVLAAEVIKTLKIDGPENLVLNRITKLDDIINLNDYKEKVFDKQPKRTKNSRFRRHPIKAGNLTVTLSNYSIKKNDKPNGEWFTSVQYGTGVGFKNQRIKDGFFKKIESIILQEESGPEFIKIINNGFSEKIASSNLMQQMYEEQSNHGKFIEPTELVEKVSEIIDELNIPQDKIFKNDEEVFVHKDTVPLTQLFALYAINKISSKVNKE